MPSHSSDATSAATLPATRATASSAAVAPHTERTRADDAPPSRIRAAPPKRLGQVRDDDRGEERVRGALGEPHAQGEVLRDPVERRRRDEGQTGRFGAGKSLDQKIGGDEGRSADEQRGGRTREAGLAVRRLEQLERDGDDQRARREREHPRGEPLRRGPEAAERRPDEQRSPSRSGVERGVVHRSLSLAPRGPACQTAWKSGGTP
jgi:hypothetical protein